MQLSIPNIIGGARLAKPHNDNFNSIQAWANGNIGQDNLAPSSVGIDELQNGSVTTPKLGEKSVTKDKLASDLLPFHVGKIVLSDVAFAPEQNKWYGIGAALPEWTAPCNARIFIHGQVYAVNASSVDGQLLLALSNNGVQASTNPVALVTGAAFSAGTTEAYSIPLVGTFDVVKDTKYTLKLMGSSNTAGTSWTIKGSAPANGANASQIALYGIPL